LYHQLKIRLPLLHNPYQIVMDTLKTVLIVEDEPMTRKMLEYVLGKNYHVVVRDSVKEALWCLKTNPHIDCILSDLYMPDIDGQEFIRQVRQHPEFSHIPIIMLSGAQESNVRIHCLEIGADDFITKPFNPKEVQVKIDAILRRSHSVANHASEAGVGVEESTLKSPKYMPWWKRLFDITVSGMALLILSPFFLFMGLLLNWDSKGPIVYKSKRVGEKYRIFEFYIFRTMRNDADQLLHKIVDLNMYKLIATQAETDTDLCTTCQRKGLCKHQLFKDGRMICESNYLASVRKTPVLRNFKMTHG
jgi:DNA-binding response OmpR family regulator